MCSFSLKGFPQNKFCIPIFRIPHTIPEQMDCYWFITAPENEKVTLRIRYIDIEAHKDCGYDYIVPFDGK